MPAQKLIDKHCLRILNMEPVNIPSNNSHHQLMAGNEDCDSLDSGLPTESGELEHGGSVKGRSNVNVTFAQKVTVVVLCFVNLINYMDRFTIAGILTEIKSHFQITDDKLGLLQTAFVLSYMIFAPLFGYLGDRYSRRAIMAFGVFLWSLTTLLGSLMESFHWFLMFRALVGIGEASYSTIAPTIISDLFVKDVRSKMLALFYFAIPVGSGLGYIVGSETFKLAGQWQWALRVTPVLGSVAIILILFCMQDPVRGLSEGRSHVSSTPWLEDIKDLCRNRSFMLSTAGFTCVAFVAGALAWWGPTFIWNGLRMQPGHENASLQDVSYIFGIITMISGLVGVALGSFMAQMLRPRWPRADPLICAFGLLMSAPLLFLASITPNSNIYLCYTLIFFGEVFLNLNWSLVADILLYVVVPNRRSTAEAFQILISHAFGDAGSPYLIGVISECLKAVLNPSTVAVGVSLSLANSVTSSPTPSPEEIARDFRSLQYALFTTSFVEVLGGFFFLLTAQYILKDKEQAHGAIACVSNEQPRNMYADQTLLTTERLTLGT